MLILATLIIEIILFVICIWAFIKCENDDELYGFLGLVIILVMIIGPIVFGAFHGFTNYYPSNDKDKARITAVTMEQGMIGAPHYRIEVEYLTNADGSVETDTFYCYLENNQLVKKAKDNLYKEVWIITGYKGGYETCKDFGTNLLKDIELIEEEE